MSNDTPPAITVCILNWNGQNYLEACLNALLAQSHPAENVILADNGSTDHSVAFVREKFPWVDVRENGGNLGFAAGNNVVLRDLAAEIVLLLNPDVVLSPDCLSALGEAMAANPTIGISGCKLWYPGGKLIQHAGGFISHSQGMPGHYGIGERDEGRHDTAHDVDYVIGAAMAVRRDTFEQIGLMDEGFFLFFEDADLCARAKRAGFRVVYLPQASGTHVESATAVKGSFAYLQRFHAGRWRYLLKHFPIEELTSQTLTAETAWLGRIDPVERRAAALAYLATRRQFLDIWSAREREGAGPVSPEFQQAIELGLTDLQDIARRREFESEALVRLAAAAVLEEQPFTSDVPLLGPFITRFRTAWNNVASRWYVGHIMTQQTEFNRLAVQQLESYEAELGELLELLEEQVVITVEMQQRIQELQARLAELAREAANPSKPAAG